MTDIVERLNKLLNDINMYDHYRPVIRQAAKEIVRLRAKLAEHENVPVRLRHIMATGKMPPDDMK
jgi:hypothetical protein